MKKEVQTQELDGPCLHDVSSARGSRNGARRRQKRSRQYTKHGLITLKRAVKGLRGCVIDRRTMLGRSLAKWRTDLIADLGVMYRLKKPQSSILP
jgi:hypothetical protein